MMVWLIYPKVISGSIWLRSSFFRQPIPRPAAACTPGPDSAERMRYRDSRQNHCHAGPFLRAPASICCSGEPQFPAAYFNVGCDLVQLVFDLKVCERAVIISRRGLSPDLTSIPPPLKRQSRGCPGRKAISVSPTGKHTASRTA